MDRSVAGEGRDEAGDAPSGLAARRGGPPETGTGSDGRAGADTGPNAGTPPWRRLLWPMATITTPVIVVFGILLAVGDLDAWVALAGGVAAAVPGAILLRLYAADMLAVARFVDTLALEGGPGEVKAPDLSGWGAALECSGAIVRLRRSWQHKNAELNRLLRSNEIILDSLPDPLLLISEGRQVVRGNSAARSLFGRDVGGRDLAVLVRIPDVLTAVDAALRHGQASTVTFMQSTPVERDLRARIEALPRPGGDGPGALVVLSDITAIRRSEQMRVDFIANASHELRTPLAALTGFIETLQGPARDDTDARIHFLGIMLEQTGRMTRLVNDLLSLSRIEMNEHSRPEGRVDLARVVTAVANSLELRARTRGITIQLVLSPNLLPVVGDDDELAQVATNLIDNAIKYAAPSSVVDVIVEPADRPATLPRREGGPVVRLQVRDRGEGIDRVHLPRLTERFYRVDAARSRALGGTGLGLAIVKHIVGRHRGILDIDSEPGVGSTFTVFLPATVT